MAETNAPRSDSEQQSARNAARRARRQQERKLRRSRRNWRVFLLVYSIVFLLAGTALCAVLYRYAQSYEASLPEHVMDDFMASPTEQQ